MPKHIRVQDQPVVATPLLSSFSGHPSCALYTECDGTVGESLIGVEQTLFPYFNADINLDGQLYSTITMHFNTDTSVFEWNVLHSEESHDSIELIIRDGFYFFSWHLHMRASITVGDAVGQPYAIMRPSVSTTGNFASQDNTLAYINESNFIQEDSIILSGFLDQPYPTDRVDLGLTMVPVDYSTDTFDLNSLTWAEGSFRIVRLGDANRSPVTPT